MSKDIAVVGTFKNHAIKFTDDTLISLTDMWKAAGSHINQRPTIWLGNLNTQNFLKTLRKSFKGDPQSLLKSSAGRYGGTFGHYQIALAYAKYLSPEFHIWANEVIKERFEEEADPELGVNRAYERAEKVYRKMGKSEEWIGDRFRGIESRKRLASAVMRYGLNPHELAQCTNVMNRTLLGADAQTIKKMHKVKNTRDAMSQLELRAFAFVEEALSEKFVKMYKDCNFMSKLEVFQKVKAVAHPVAAIMNR